MHLRRHAGTEDDGRRVAVADEKTRVRGTHAPAEYGLLARDFAEIVRERRDDRMVGRDLRPLGDEPLEPDLRLVLAQPRIGLRKRLDEALELFLDGFDVLLRQQSHAAAQDRAVGRRARVVAGFESPDGARQRAAVVRIERVGERVDPQAFEILDGLGQLVAFVERVDGFPAPRDAGRLAAHLHHEPQTSDARRLHVQIARLERDARVGLVAALDAGERAEAADLLVHYVLQDDGPARPQPDVEQDLQRHRHGGEAALHVGRASAEDPAVDELARQRVELPVADGFPRDGVHVAVEEQRPRRGLAAVHADDVGAAAEVAALGRHVRGMLGQFREVRHPLIDVEAHGRQRRRDEILNRAFLARLAVELNEALEEGRDFVRLIVHRLENARSFRRGRRCCHGSCPKREQDRDQFEPAERSLRKTRFREWCLAGGWKSGSTNVSMTAGGRRQKCPTRSGQPIRPPRAGEKR